MAHHAETLRNLTQGVSDEQARWKPDAQSWSVLEVINHLCDEERADFRVRLDGILHHPSEPWPGIDPAGWVTERHYNRRSLEESVADFVQAREESLTWLKGLSSPNWQTEYETSFGRITAGDMLASWLGHDLLHMRQLVELHWAYMVRMMHPHKMEYAGSW